MGKCIPFHPIKVRTFISNAELIYRTQSAMDDYHGQMSAANFEKQVVEELILNVSPQSVTVLDNVPHHCL
jgi:hypothetical protein